MKKRINIMLSEEALQRADDSGNRSEYIENLILGTPQVSDKAQTYSKAEVTIIDKIDKILETMGTPGAFIPENKTSAAELKKPENNLVGSATPNSRTMKDVLSDITRVERERDDKLEWSQDPEEHRRVTADCTEKTTLLWAEWRELKNDKESF